MERLEICQHIETHISFVQNPNTEILGDCLEKRCLDCYIHWKIHSYVFRNKFFIFLIWVTRSDFLEEKGFNLNAFQLTQVWNILWKGFRILIKNVFKKMIVHDSFFFFLLSGIYWSPNISPEILGIQWGECPFRYYFSLRPRQWNHLDTIPCYSICQYDCYQFCGIFLTPWVWFWSYSNLKIV